LFDEIGTLCVGTDADADADADAFIGSRSIE
jgi:hypothetical protein